MHIVFGGTCNGKRDYVKQLLAGRRYDWFEGQLPAAGGLSVTAGVEQWIKRQLDDGRPEGEAAEEVLQAVRGEQIWILTDLHRGIVPADPLERKVRDATGRLYQQLFNRADTVTRIWYGIPQTMKGAEQFENLYKNGR